MFTLPERKFEYMDFEPVIDAKTMEIHYTKHHQAYVDNLNAAIKAETSLENMNIDELLMRVSELPMSVRTAIRNNGGGHLNHTLFWETLAKPKSVKLSSTFETVLISAFGSLESFKDQFEIAAKTRFGSGWAWLVLSDDTLEVMSTPNQDAPIMEGKVALLGLDVWEHAYYLNYQNRRPDYVAAFWDVVNWDVVENRYKAAMK